MFDTGLYIWLMFCFC